MSGTPAFAPAGNGASCDNPMMRAIRLHGPGDVRLDEVGEPDSKETLIRVEACGVCGSDIHFVQGSARTGHLPITLGHEVAGTVLASPPGTFEPGTEVVAQVGTHCLECPRCGEGRSNLCERAAVLGIDVDGGFAEQVAVPVDSVLIRPPGVPADAAATSVDAGATALHAIERRARVGESESVLIIGAGGLGTYGIQWAQRAGPGAVIVADSDESALEAASALGVDETVLVEPGLSIGRRVKMLSGGGVDVAVEFVGTAATVDAAIKSLRPGGRAVAVGVGPEPVASLPVVLWSTNEYTLLGSYGSLPGDAGRILDALAAGDVMPPATVDIPLQEGADLLVSMAAGERRVRGRPVIRP